MFDDATQFAEGVLLVVAALLPVVNPLGAAPVFLAMTPDADSATRAALARNVAFNGMVLRARLDVPRQPCPSLFRGVGAGRATGRRTHRLQHRLEAAGGGRRRRAPGDCESRGDPRQGVLSVHAAAHHGDGCHFGGGDARRQFPSTAQPFVADAVSSAAGIRVVVGSIYLCYRHAQRMGDLLGRNGMAVVLRLSAFILFCIGVQIAWNGARSLALEVTVPAAVRPLDSSP